MGNACAGKSTAEEPYADEVPPDGDLVEAVTEREMRPSTNSEEVEPPPPPYVDPNVRYCKMGCNKPVQPGKTRNGRPFDTCCRSCVLNPGLGFHDPNCGGQKPSAASRRACPQGSRCRKRDKGHLEQNAHPLDQDYAVCCAADKITPEPLSLKVVFDWADEDGSGKLSREELEATFSIIKKICKDHLPELTEEAWKTLDEDGNGVLNFMEFASWAGPRMGLPLGMQRMIHRTDSMESSKAMTCSVLGCPCENFEEDTGGGGGGGGVKLKGLLAAAAAGKKTKGSAVCSCCKHKKELHEHRVSSEEVPFPDYWNYQSGKFSEIMTLKEEAFKDFQHILRATHRGKWTRDRTKHNPANPRVPEGYDVVKVSRNENSASWQEYACRRAEVLTRLHEEEDEGSKITKFEDVKSMVAYREIAGSKADRLVHEANEWYLFHGTAPATARKIMQSDFRVGCAGANTGTLYGRGLYFAESITKADEYAKPDENGNYAVLLCRVLGGHVLYCDEVDPDPEVLVRQCISGPFDCVLGDREKARGTYREFVLFDSEDVYPEYVIEYKRRY